jgi:hypothetical protein
VISALVHLAPRAAYQIRVPEILMKIAITREQQSGARRQRQGKHVRIVGTVPT